MKSKLYYNNKIFTVLKVLGYGNCCFSKAERIHVTNFASGIADHAVLALFPDVFREGNIDGKEWYLCRFEEINAM